MNTTKKREPEGWRYSGALRAVKFLNLIVMTAIFGAVWFCSYSEPLQYPYPGGGFWAVLGFYAVLYTVLGRVYDAFLVSLSHVAEMSYSQILALLLTDSLMFVIFWIAGRSFPALWPMAAAFAGQAAAAALWCYFANRWYYHAFRPRNSLVVQETRQGMREVIQDYGLTQKFHVKATVSPEVCIGELDRMLQDVDTVFLCGVHSHERNVILKRCVDLGIRCYVIPRIGDTLMNSAKVVHLFHLPLLSVSRFCAPLYYRIVKRLADILISGLAAVLLSPLMLITALAIKLEDGGPVLYKQTRLTKDRKEFKVLKFRSMRVDAEKDGVARLSSGDRDPRITRIGRVIRATRLDELPQLLNILKGDMSIVGPRPERPEIAAQYEQELPEFALRLQVPAGLTGYAQVYGKYNTEPYDKLQMDLMYIAHASLREDLQIIFATVKVLFVKDSTEGVAEGQTTAAR